MPSSDDTSLISPTRSTSGPSRRRVRTLCGALLTLGVILAPVSSMPASEDDEKSEHLLERERMTDWMGHRERIEDSGFDVQAGWVFNVQGNTGGADQAIEYAGLFQVGLGLDFERLTGTKGLGFFVSGSWSGGRNLSLTIGNFFRVAEAWNGRTFQLSQLFFVKSLHKNRIDLAVGRLSAGNDFAFLRAGQFFVNAGMNGNPLSIFANEPGFQADPVSQWGLRLFYKNPSGFFLKAAAYNADPRVADPDSNGLDFTFNPQDGVLAILAAGYAAEIDMGGKPMPGIYKIGFYYDTSDLPLLTDSALTRNGQYGYYLMFQQQVYREEDALLGWRREPLTRNRIRDYYLRHRPEVHEGLTPWFAVAVSPRDEISPMPLFLSGGVIYRGLFPDHDWDVTGLAVYHGRFSDVLPVQSAETVIEISHRFRVAPWLYAAPDVQYVFNPGGIDIPDALVVGFEVGIAF